MSQKLRGAVAFFTVAMLAACSPSGLSPLHESRSHGPAIYGYGPVQFNMPRDVAYQALQGQGRFEVTPHENREVLTYNHYMGYLEVQVRQHFNEDQKATKAELYVVDAARGARTLNECRSFNNIVYGMLYERFNYPDWEPRITKRGRGESGVVVYTFSDSSSITLSYDYAGGEGMFSGDSGLCTVKLAFNPPWV